jgi:hypothetical protein
MFGYLTHVSDGKRLEMFPWTQARRRLTECERTEREWINQELESEAGATEPQFRIDMVPESEEGSHFRRLSWRWPVFPRRGAGPIDA